jgi:TonB family protein
VRLLVTCSALILISATHVACQSNAAPADQVPRKQVRKADPPARPTESANPVDYYPQDARRRQEQGAPIVMACVGADGKLLGEPQVVESSGFPELDDAAIKVAKANRYAAATENGVALPKSCLKFKVKFVISD